MANFTFLVIFRMTVDQISKMNSILTDLKAKAKYTDDTTSRVIGTIMNFQKSAY